MVEYKFYINSTEIDEPIGWDAVQVTLTRSETYFGLETLFSENITFNGVGAEIIKQAFEESFIDAKLNFKVLQSCDGFVTSETYLDGILNLAIYKEVDNQVTVLIESSGLQRDFKNNISVPVSMDATTSLMGNPLTAIAPYEIRLHSKELVKQTKLVGGNNYNSNTYTPIPTSDTLYAILPFGEIQGDEFEGANLTLFPTITSSEAGTNPDRIFRAKEKIDVEVSYNFIGIVREFFPINRSYNFAMSYRVGVGGWGSSFASTIHDYGPKAPLGGSLMNQPIDLNGTLNLTLEENEDLYIYFSLVGYDNDSTNPREMRLTVEFTTCELTLKAVTKANPSVSKGIQLFEAFYKMSEYITGVQDCFRSNFFGRLNSVVPYAQNGCGAWVALTNGLNIRNMLDKEGNKFPIVCSFEQLYKACDAIWGLGMKIERDNGKDYIRIEKREYFYNPEAIISLPNVSGITTAPDTEACYNQFQVGYSKTNLSTGGLNGIDEFNSIRNYSIPLEKAKNKLVSVSEIATSGYLIEQTRRAQFSELPTTDFETDNDLFFICLNTDEITSDLYTDPPVSTTYQAGEVSERDENFTGITNLISPETVYNLRISPVRMAKNWYPIIKGQILTKSIPNLKFLSGTFNYLVGSETINSCVNSSGPDIENEDINDSNVERNDPIFEPVSYEFEYPISYSEFKIICNNSEKAIAFSCSGGNYQIGFIKNFKYEPNAEGGIGTFKLTKGSCSQGGFDDSFNDGFDIGNC